MAKYKLTGFSTPFGGLSFDKQITSKERFAYLLIYLESKRILVNPIEMEKKEWCVSSVLEIKKTLAEIVIDISFTDAELAIIRNMIDACNRYLDAVSPLKLPTIIFKDGDFWEDMEFDRAMKLFRSEFREQLQVIESLHGLKFNKDIPSKF